MTEIIEAPAAAGASASAERFRPLRSLAFWVLVATFATSVVAVRLSDHIARSVRGVPTAFFYIFMRDEPPGAMLACAIAAIAMIAAALWQSASPRFVERLAQRPQWFILAATAAMVAAAQLVYRAHPLSMDEFAPVFQSGAFAHGSLTGQVPPALLPRLLPPWSNWFIEASSSGKLISSYWPGFALLLTPFTAARCPWLLNPLIGGATLLVLWRLGRTLWPGTAAAGWAVLLAVASPAFVVNAISFYSMPAHLLASLGFVALVLEPTPRRLIAAGALGSFALALHNPVPHVLFATPWVLSIAWSKERLSRLAALAAGYLPGAIVLCAGWVWLRSRFHPAVHDPGFAAKVHDLWEVAFARPSMDLLMRRTINTAELTLWAVPGLLVIAAFAAWRFRASRPVQLLTWSAALTFIAYVFVPYDQGHGWGYRYFHSAWGVLPLLAGAALGAADVVPFLRRMMWFAAVMSLVGGNALRFHQVRTYIDAHLAQIPNTDGSTPLEVVFVRIDQGYYTVDLVQNDPFMNGRRWILISRGDQADEEFMRQSFPRSHLAARGKASTVWQID